MFDAVCELNPGDDPLCSHLDCHYLIFVVLSTYPFIINEAINANMSSFLYHTVNSAKLYQYSLLNWIECEGRVMKPNVT